VLGFGRLLGCLVAVLVAAEGRNIPYQRYQLDNRLDVVLHEDHRIPLIAVRVEYYVGSIHDPVGKRGLAHLTEHLMFRGTEHIADGVMMSEFPRVGAIRANATTDDRTIATFETVPASQLDVALWAEADRMGLFPARVPAGDACRRRAQDSDQRGQSARARHDAWAGVRSGLEHVVRARAGPLRDALAEAHSGERGLDDVGRAQVLPVFGRERPVATSRS
jgi:hypothetical protein